MSNIVYRTRNTETGEVKYVRAASKAQARSHIARTLIEVQVAKAADMVDDVDAGRSIACETAGEPITEPASE